MQIDVLEVDGNYYGMYFSEWHNNDMIFCFSSIVSLRAYRYKQSKQN